MRIPLTVIARNIKFMALPCLAILFFTSCAQLGPGGYPSDNTMLQVMGGITIIDKDEVEFNLANSIDPLVNADPATERLPLLGVAVQTPIGGDIIKYGLEGGMIWSWWGDDVDTLTTDNKTFLKVDTVLRLNEFFFGAYGSTDISDTVRVYAGAGPMLIYGIYEVDTKEGDQDTSTYNEWDRTESDVGLGVYVRGGIEFSLSSSTMLGVGVRAFKSDVDFNRTVGDVNVTAVQAMATFSFRF